jgi:HlyD family secretion protein
MSMSKVSAAAVIILGVVLVGGAIAVIAPDRGDSPRTTAAVAATEPHSERLWRAVAPGRIEPPSGIIKVASPSVGVVSKVLVKVNDIVFAGEPLIQLNDEEVRSRYSAAEAQVGMRLRLRNEQAAAKGGEDRRKAEDAVTDAETAVFDAQNIVDKAAAEWRTSGAPSSKLTEARSALARAQDDLSRKQAQLRNVLVNAPLPSPNEAQVASARGDLSFARVNLEKLKVRAPIDGTVLQININPGELAAPSAPQPLLLIANLSTLNVRAELDERDISEIKIGQVALVRADAFPGREFSGTVTSIAPLVEPARLGTRGPNSRSDVDAVEVMVKLAQPGPLTAGMRVDVYFGQGEKTAKQDK